MRFCCLFLFAPLALGGCHSTSSSSDQSATGKQGADSLRWVDYSVADIQADTTLFHKPEQVGELDDRILAEASGVAQSQTNPNYLWTQQDSGNTNELQLLNRQGGVVGRYVLGGITNRDWEDIAVGPGPLPGRSYVYVAEIGDNQRQHPVKTIYRFLEPAINTNQLPVNETITAIDSIKLRLPDGPKNAEAFLLDPGTLALYILSKERFTTLYKASYPQSLTSTTLMQRLLITPLNSITASALSPDGTELLVRSYKQAYYFRRKINESVEEAMKRAPRSIDFSQEAQGEAIGWVTDRAGQVANGFFTVSERTGFFAEPLYFYRRR